jgi:hypothetical protein
MNLENCPAISSNSELCLTKNGGKNPCPMDPASAAAGQLAHQFMVIDEITIKLPSGNLTYGRPFSSLIYPSKIVIFPIKIVIFPLE